MSMRSLRRSEPPCPSVIGYARHKLPVVGRTHRASPRVIPRLTRITLKEAPLFDQRKPSNHLTPRPSPRFLPQVPLRERKLRGFLDLPHALGDFAFMAGPRAKKGGARINFALFPSRNTSNLANYDRKTAPLAPRPPAIFALACALKALASGAGAQ